MCHADVSRPSPPCDEVTASRRIDMTKSRRPTSASYQRLKLFHKLKRRENAYLPARFPALIPEVRRFFCAV
jgi:hypothetical protein